MYKRSSLAATSFAISCGSLLGIPPLFGFWGKLMLFAAGVASGQIILVIIAAVSSAISAWYYLRLIGLSLLSSLTTRSETVKVTLRWPLIAAVISAIIAIGGPFILSALDAQANQAVVEKE